MWEENENYVEGDIVIAGANILEEVEGKVVGWARKGKICSTMTICCEIWIFSEDFSKKYIHFD